MNDFFFHPVFQDAIADIATLSVQVHQHPTAGAKPYAVVGGRSNARWWLIPLENRRVAVSGLALFQPLLASARAMKTAASFLSVVGLSRLWARNTVYIAGEPTIAADFPSSDGLSFAYFTGTDSPHRKVAVQIMDGRGNLKGFAKVTRNPNVSKLLMYETATLEQLQKLGLQSAHLPRVIFSGERKGSFILVTDTLKTRWTRSTTKFSAPHHTFIQELAQKTAGVEPVLVSDIGAHFQARFNLVRHQIELPWQQRLEKSIDLLDTQVNTPLNFCQSHGDFTPWNTFFVDGKLYVFDWEYAESKYPPSFDLIHFLLSEPVFRKRPADEQIKCLVEQIKTTLNLISEIQALIHITVYLIAISLRYIERSGTSKKATPTWDGAKEYAELLEKAFATATELSSNQ